MIPEADPGSLCGAYGWCARIPISNFWLWVVAAAAVLRLQDLIGSVQAAVVYGSAELGLGVAVG